AFCEALPHLRANVLPSGAEVPPRHPVHDEGPSGAHDETGSWRETPVIRRPDNLYVPLQHLLRCRRLRTGEDEDKTGDPPCDQHESPEPGETPPHPSRGEHSSHSPKNRPSLRLRSTVRSEREGRCSAP